MNSNKNLFQLKFSDNPAENFIKMNGKDLEGVVRINTALIAGEQRGVVVLEMLSTNVVEMLADTIIQTDNSDLVMEMAGHTMYEELEGLLDGESCPSPMMLTEAFQNTVERLIHHIGVERTNASEEAKN